MTEEPNAEWLPASEPTAKQKKAWAKKAAHKARKIAKTDQAEARIREIVREELGRAGFPIGGPDTPTFAELVAWQKSWDKQRAEDDSRA